MKPTSRVSACALLILAISACSKPEPCPVCPPPPAPPPKPDLAKEADAIKALDAQWVEAIASKDPDKIAAFYGDGALMLPPNEDVRSGDAIKESWATMSTMPNVSLTFTPDNITVDHGGTMAVDVGTYKFSFDSPTGARLEDHGKYAQVWQKQNNVWKCIVDMYNTSVPLPPPVEPAKKK